MLDAVGQSATRAHLYEESVENWLRALDDEFVVCWIGAPSANTPVTYDEAKKWINKLICYNIEIDKFFENDQKETN